MACRLFGAKPLSEPMIPYCELSPWEHMSVKFELKYNIIRLMKMHLKMSSEQIMTAILSRLQCVNSLRPIKNGRYFEDNIFTGICALELKILFKQRVLMHGHQGGEMSGTVCVTFT